MKSGGGRYNRIISCLLCRQEGTTFRQKIIWLYNLIEQEFRQIRGKPLGNGIENHMKVQ